MIVLVFNAGSSSLKFGVFRIDANVNEVFKGSYERFGNGRCDYRFRHGTIDERGQADCGGIGEARAWAQTAAQCLAFPDR